MKNLVIIPFCFMTFLTSCNKDKNNCVEHVTLEEVFTVKSNCTYRFEKNNTTINLCLADINDNRTYGAECAITWGGLAQIHLVVNNDTLEFEIRGCQGDTDYSIYSNDLPSEEINGYQVKLMKMYPLSENLNGPPESIDDYKLEFVLLNQ